VLEHLLPVADEVLGVDDRRFNSLDEVLQRGLALDLPRAAQVEAVQVQQVEGVEDQLVLPAGRLRARCSFSCGMCSRCICAP
jgi:hypothetical protein